MFLFLLSLHQHNMLIWVMKYLIKVFRLCVAGQLAYRWCTHRARSARSEDACAVRRPRCAATNRRLCARSSTVFKCPSASVVFSSEIANGIAPLPGDHSAKYLPKVIRTCLRTRSQCRKQLALIVDNIFCLYQLTFLGIYIFKYIRSVLF